MDAGVEEKETPDRNGKSSRNMQTSRTAERMDGSPGEKRGTKGCFLC